MKHDWEYKKLKDVCRKGSSNIQQNKIVGIDGEYPVYGASGYVQNVDFYHQEHPYIGIVKDGSGVGRVNKYPAKSSLLGTMQYILPNEGMSLGYLVYCLQSLKLSKFAAGAAIPHIYFRDYGECLSPVPPLEVQERIVGELDKVREIIEKKKEQVKGLDSLAQSIFYDMFGDPVENEKGWEVKKTKDFGEVKIGPFGSLLHKSDYISGGIPLVNPIHMRDGKIFVDNNFTISESKAKELSSYLMQEGDFVFARRGEIGRCAIVRNCDNGCLCGTGSLFVRFSQMMDRLFLRYVVNSKSFVAELVDKAKGATMLNINCGIVEELRIPNPPLSLQQAFAEKVEGIERQKELITASIKEVETLFDARMEYWFGE